MEHLEAKLAAFDGLRRLGWVEEASPVTSLSELASELDVASLHVKRDDLIGALMGGTKVRKLDFILAQPELRAAKGGFASTGAIGSGHLSTLAAAARELGRPFEACTFWEPPSERVLEELAFTASNADELRFSGNIYSLFVCRPWTVLAREHRGRAVIPPGGTMPAGIAGTARGGIELAMQVAAGELPRPDRVFVPLGSGGTLIGLAMGFAMSGLETRICAVSTVAPQLSTRGRLRRLHRRAVRWLSERGIAGAEAELPEIRIDREQLGPGYGHATAEGLAAGERLARHGVPLEPIYSGKAMAGLLAQCSGPTEHVLFWLTPRRPEPLPAAPDWRERLPESLRRRLPEIPEETPHGS